MKAFSKFGVLLAVGLMACAALAASAQAQVVNPPNTPVVGTATNPTLDYEGTIVRCNTGTASGTTGSNSPIVDVSLTFSGNCNIAGLGATVTCNGQARLRALNATTNAGEVDELLTGFSCVVTVSGVCTVTVAAQQLPITGGINQANLLNEGGATAIDANVDVAASRTGSSLCGPATGVGGFTGVYDLNPDVSFD